MSAVQKWATGLWAVAIAITAEKIFPVFWWYPYCNRQDDGPGYPGVGFPFPYAKFTGVSSMEFFAMPHVYVANILVLSATIFFILWACFSRIKFCGVVLSRLALVVGGAALIVVAAFEGIPALITFVPVESIASKPDNYFSYRPEFIALHGYNRACTSYPVP